VLAVEDHLLPDIEIRLQRRVEKDQGSTVGNLKNTVATTPKTGAMASRISIRREFFSELPEFNITATVLSPSVKS
jgi:hypothetical protein